jgi:hypothetical protein
MTVKKAKPTKKKSVKKKATETPAKRVATRKRASKKPVVRPYVQPKTAAELGIACSTLVDGGKCGKPVLWFDYQLGERNHMAGFVCDEHRVSNRSERLAVKQAATVTA